MVAFFSEPRKVSTAVSSDVTEREVQETVSIPLGKLDKQANIMHEVISNQAGASLRNIERLQLGVETLRIASQEVVGILHDHSAQNSEESSQSYISSMSR